MESEPVRGVLGVERVSQVDPQGPHGRGGALALDANADGWFDLLFQDATGGFHLLVYQRGEWEETPLELAADVVGSLAIDHDPSGSMHLLIAGADGVARLYQRTSPARPNWLRVHLKGDKSNRQGVGAVLEAKAATSIKNGGARVCPWPSSPAGAIV